jgi:hypothetical protein
MSTVKLTAASGSGSISLKGPASSDANVDLLDTSGNLSVSGNLQVGGDSGVAGTWHLETYNGSGDGTAIIAGSTGAKIEIRDTGSSERFVLAANGDCNVYSYLNGDNISFHTTDGSGTTNRLKIRSNGDVDLETGDLVIATAGKGIMFHPHDETASDPGSDSNLLSDYEEGTFTPDLSSFSTLNFNSRSGRYIKTGNMVWCAVHFNLAGSNVGTGGQLRVTGLPFTCKNENARAGGTLNWHDGIVSNFERPYLLMENNTTQLNWYKANGYGLAPTDLDAISNVSFYITTYYEVA